MAEIMIGEVYFVTDGTAIKIGYSGAAALRVKDLQTSHHAPLKLLLVLPGSKDDEKALHHRFQHLRIKGEWFRSEPEILDFIEKPDLEIAKIEGVRRELAAWAKHKTGHAKAICETLDTTLRAIVEKKPMWEPLLTAAHCIEGLKVEIENARRPRRPNPIPFQ